MKRLLTFLSAAILMLMVPIGALAWDTVTFQSSTQGVDSRNMTKADNDGNKHELTLDLSSFTGDVTFMFYVSNDHGNLGRNDGATENFDLSTNSSMTSYGHKGSDKKWVLKHSTSKYAKYKITAQWSNESNGVHYWDITIEGTELKPVATTTSSVYFVGSILGVAWGNKTYALTQSGDEWYVDFTAAQVNNGTREFNGAANAFDFRFIETMSDNNDYIAYPATAATTLTAGADYVSGESSTSTDNYWRIIPTDNATSYRFYFKNDNGTRKVKYTVETSSSGGGGGETPVVSGKNYYLVGNFMNTDGSDASSINYDNRIFLMKYIGNNQYSFDVPATLTVYSQILSVDGSTTQAYGPSSNQTSGPNNDGTINGTLTSASAKTNNYWNMSDRGIDSDGMYTYTITVDANGVPTSWSIKHTMLTRVAYFLPANGVAQPAYMTRNNSSSAGDNKFFGNVYLSTGQECFVVGNIKGKSVWSVSNKPMPTVTKLYKQGNGGGYAVGEGTNPSHPSGYDDWHKVYPALSTGFKVTPAGAMTLEYNPSMGQDGQEKLSGNNNIGGEVKRADGDPMAIIESMKVIGPGVDTDWTLSNARAMTYNETLKCWEITINTTKAASSDNIFRFVANNSWDTNWYENGTAATDKAKIPYNESGDGHAATEADPNVVEKTNDAHATTARDIIFNRPAGEWTIRFYIETISSDGGNSFKYNYYYTITGEENTDPDLTLTPGVAGGTYTFDNYTEGTPMPVKTSYTNGATMFKGSMGDSYVPRDNVDEEQELVSDSFGNDVDGNQTMYLVYEEGNVYIYSEDKSSNPDASPVRVVEGKNSIIFTISAVKEERDPDTDEDGNDVYGPAHTYTYTFNVPASTELDFSPKSGFFINKAMITITGGTAPYTYTIKDASGNKLSEGTSSSATFTISTPGYLTVTDASNATKTSDEKFDFTYSTSENYANYYNNGTTAQSVAQDGGKDATNIFLKKADYENMRIYAWDYTYDQKLQAYQRGETTDIDDEIAALKDPKITKSSATYDNDGNEGKGDKTWNLTAPGYKERDPHVMLTEPYPGTLMSDSRTIEIDGETYYYLTLPLSRLHKSDYDVGIIMTRNDENPANMSQNADLYKTTDNEIKGNSSFIYSSSEDPRFATPTGDNVVFYTNPNNWPSVKAYMWNGSGGEGNRNYKWEEVPPMEKSGSVYYYEPTQKWDNVIFYNGNTSGGDGNQTPTMGYGGGRYYYDGANEKKTTYINKFNDISDAVAGENVVFYKNTNNWSNVKIYLYNTDSDKNTIWDGAPDMKKFDGITYYYALGNEEKKWNHVIFRDGGSNKTNDLDYGGGRKMYEGSPAKGNGGTTQEGNAEYITYIDKPSKYTVEVQNHPNGDDYLRAMPSDKTVLLDPTWGGVITPKAIGDEEVSVPSWNGVEGDNVGYRKFVKQNLTQTIYGLDNSKTYTVQAIVRVWDGKKVTLKVGDGTAVESAAVGASGISYVNKNGRVDDRYTEGPDPDDPYFLKYMGNANQGFGWQKIEATGNPTEAGNLVITITTTNGTEMFDLADVVLLESANTAGNYWTKIPDSEAANLQKGEVDMTNRETYNAFSFFDRNTGNPNAIIKASNRTVIGLQSGIAQVQDAANANVDDTVDHRQSRNTISLNEDGKTWSGRYLYLYDESDATMTDDYSWSDCNAYGATVDFTMIGAKYDRKFTKGVHSTLFLPYSVTTAQLKTAGFTQLQMVDVDNVKSDKIPLITWDLTKETPMDYSTVAGQGYIVIASTNVDYAALSDFYKPDGGIAVQAATSSSAQTKEATGLVGAYKYQRRYKESTVDGTTYMNYSYWNDLFRVLGTEAQGGSEIKPFRATFAVPQGTVGSARQLSTYMISADELFTPTGISRQGVEEKLSGNVYTIDGRLVSTDGDMSKLTRGIYVRSGRKIVVK